MGRKARYIQLDDAGRKALEMGFKRGKKAVFRQRCHYLLLSNQGRQIHEIASIYQTTRQAVARWFDRYKASGIDGLHTQKGRGEKPILRLDNERDVETVKKLVSKHAQDLDPILAELESKLGKQMSKRTLQRFLKSLVMSGSDSAA